MRQFPRRGDGKARVRYWLVFYREGNNSFSIPAIIPGATKREARANFEAHNPGYKIERVEEK